jgi:hypothetical protein
VATKCCLLHLKFWKWVLIMWSAMNLSYLFSGIEIVAARVTIALSKADSLLCAPNLLRPRSNFHQTSTIIL